MNQLIGGLITLYQRFISPYKGFRCAYGVYYGKGTCSGIVKQIVLTQGLFRGWSAIVSQFRACRCAYHQLAQQADDDAGERPEQEDEEAPEDEKEKKREGLCPGVLGGACLLPDPSDCALGGAAEGAGSACGGVVDAITGVCSCV